jgi:YHS domain-containing protein
VPLNRTPHQFGQVALVLRNCAVAKVPAEVSPKKALYGSRRPLRYLGYGADSASEQNRKGIEKNRHPILLAVPPMNDINELAVRMENVLAAVKDKAKQQQKARIQDHVERQELLKDFEKVQARVVAIAKPRLELLAKKAGDRATVTPSVSQTRRSAVFEFRSPKAFITMTFSVAPDASVKNVVVDSDLRIVPVLWKYESHSEFTSPITALDEAGLSKWLDDRIVGFLELYIQIHEGEILDKAEYVEDPVAKIKFPKFAAGASLDHGGQTYFFVDEKTRSTFAKEKGIAAS